MGYPPHPPPQPRLYISADELMDPYDPTPAEYAAILKERGLEKVSKVRTEAPTRRWEQDTGNPGTAFTSAVAVKVEAQARRANAAMERAEAAVRTLNTAGPK